MPVVPRGGHPSRPRHQDGPQYAVSSRHEQPTTISSINPYYLAFSGILSGLAAEKARFGPSDMVEVIFGDQTPEKDKIVQAWDLLKRNGSPDTQELIGGPSFLDDRQVLPLQAADFIAWWVRKLAMESRREESAIVPWQVTTEIPRLEFNYAENRLRDVFENTVRSRRKPAS
jgi:hypothetical protein